MICSPLRSIVLAASLVSAASFAAQASDTVVVQWDAQALESIRETHPGPPMVARMLAVAHTCMYDASVAYTKHSVGTLSGGWLRRPKHERTAANIDKAISFAAYRCLVDLFPQPDQVARLTAQMTTLGYDATDVAQDDQTPSGIGNTVAAMVLDYRHTDGSNQKGELNGGAPYSDYSGYVPVNSWDTIADPSRWQPLRVIQHDGTLGPQQKFIAPFWGSVTGFSVEEPTDFFPEEGPATYPSRAYEIQTQQILDYSANLTDQQKVIAEYWADGPSSELPPGHWALFATFVSRRDHHDAIQDAQMFFAVTNGILDASVVSWGAKRFWDSVRPVTSVHFLKSGQMIRAWGGPNQGTKMIRGEDWRPYQAATVVTPPFPEYISGHSIFSATGAEILKRFTHSDAFGGSVVIPAGSSRVEAHTPAADVTLSWPTFSDAADEAGISRRYGGIHFIDGDLRSRLAGRQVGRHAWEKAEACFRGDADECAAQ